jgi:hypothetical protein
MNLIIKYYDQQLPVQNKEHIFFLPSIRLYVPQITREGYLCHKHEKSTKIKVQFIIYYMKISNKSFNINVLASGSFNISIHK